LLAVNPKYTPALNNLAYLYCEKLNRLDRAFDIATQARTYAPDDATTADTLGWILFRRGEYHNAVGLLQESAEKEPTNSEVQYHLGMAHYMLGEEDLARVAFERSVAAGADFPSKDEAVHRLALLKSNASSADPAMLAELEKRVKAEPNDPVALVRLADIQDRNGALRDAAANYESALKLNPRDVQVMLELAKLYSGPLQNLPKARELAKSAHELAPDDAQISETLGRMLFRTGDYKWSLTLLEEASRSVTGQPELTYDLARAYYSVGQVQDARTALQGLIQSGVKFDKDFEARRMLSMIDAGKDPVAAQAALPDARKILETEPDYVPAIMVSALAEEQRGNPSGAVQQYEKVLAAYHDFSPAIRQMALIFEVRADDDKRAYDLATTALNSYPDDPQLARALGILNYRREDYTSAVHFLQESQSKLPDDPEIFYYLGMSHYKLKEVGESKTELQRALDSNIPDQEADEAKRVLDELKGAQAPSLSEQPIN
jgi:tetratricopeptide (TPR) repeat protein